MKNEGPKDLLQRDVDNTEIEVTDTVLHKPKDPEYIFKENVGKASFFFVIPILVMAIFIRNIDLPY